MRVAVVGGYGVFGERLCRLLARDGHEVIVCGRDSDKAAALAAEIGGQSQQFDLTGDLAHGHRRIAVARKEPQSRRADAGGCIGGM